jgi:hypothetical protein
LTKYLPEAQKHAIDFVEVQGRTKIMVQGQVSNYIPNPTFERIGRPGAQEEYFKLGNPDGKSYREIIGRGIDCPPAFREASARLELMDEQGVDYAMMYPTLGSLIEERMKDDPDLCATAIHALNLWMLEAWPYAYENRIFSAPVITPGILDAAIAELEFVLEHGARAILMRPAPAWGYRGPRSFALPEFDPFWQRVEMRASSWSCTHPIRDTRAIRTSGKACRAKPWPSGSHSLSARPSPPIIAISEMPSPP